MLMTHLGTNQFIREVYIPHLWNHRYSLLDAKSGKVKQGQVRKYDIAGPLCFQVIHWIRLVHIGTVMVVVLFRATSWRKILSFQKQCEAISWWSMTPVATA